MNAIARQLQCETGHHTVRQGDDERGSSRFDNKCCASLSGRFKPANYNLLVCILEPFLQKMVKKLQFGKLMRHRSSLHIMHNNIFHIKPAIDREPAAVKVVRKEYAILKLIVCIAVVNWNISKGDHLVVHGGGQPPNAQRLNMGSGC